ncbi:MAG: hypothetical protein HGA65_17465, partial [Oscillochloris sp.]|nr:hypothetical protein [Oscillochloris sp.]
LERAASHVAGQPDPLVPLRICCPDLPRPAADALDCCLSLDPVERITSAEELRRQLHLTKPIMRRPLRRRTPAPSLDYLRTPLLALIVMIVLGGVVFLARPGESVSDHVQALIPTMQDTPISGIVTRVPTYTPLPVPSYNGMTPTLGPDVLISQTAPLTNMRLRPAPYLGDLGLELECIGDQHAINHAIASNQDFIALNCPSGLQIFRVSNGRAILNFTRPANAFAFNPHQPMLVTSFDGSVVDYWDLLNGQRREISMMVEHATITTLDFSPDGQILVILDAQGRMSFANRNTGDIPIDLRDNAEIAYSTTAFAPDGHYFAAGSRAGEVYVWERIGTKYQMLMIYDSAGLGEAVSMAFNADETLLIVGFREGVQGYVLGDVTDGKQLTGGSWHNPQVVIDPTSGLIAIGDDAGRLDVYQDCNPPLLNLHISDTSAVYGLAFLADGTELASRTEAGAQVWRVADQSDS